MLRCTKCNHKCGFIPFKCSACCYNFCINCRLQEDHNCEKMDVLKAKKIAELKHMLENAYMKDNHGLVK